MPIVSLVPLLLAIAASVAIVALIRAQHARPTAAPHGVEAQRSHEPSH